MVSISLYDHRAKSMSENKLHCACGQEFSDMYKFFEHQKYWLNYQLKENKIKVA